MEILFPTMPEIFILDYNRYRYRVWEHFWISSRRDHSGIRGYVPRHFACDRRLDRATQDPRIWTPRDPEIPPGTASTPPPDRAHVYVSHLPRGVSSAPGLVENEIPPTQRASDERYSDSNESSATSSYIKAL